MTFSCGAGPSNRCIPQAGAGPVSCNGLLGCFRTQPPPAPGSAQGRPLGLALGIGLKTAAAFGSTGSRALELDSGNDSPQPRGSIAHTRYAIKVVSQASG